MTTLCEILGRSAPSQGEVDARVAQLAPMYDAFVFVYACEEK